MKKVASWIINKRVSRLLFERVLKAMNIHVAKAGKIFEFDNDDWSSEAG